MHGPVVLRFDWFVKFIRNLKSFLVIIGVGVLLSACCAGVAEEVAYRVAKVEPQKVKRKVIRAKRPSPARVPAQEMPAEDVVVPKPEEAKLTPNDEVSPERAAKMLEGLGYSDVNFATKSGAHYRFVACKNDKFYSLVVDKIGEIVRRKHEGPCREEGSPVPGDETPSQKKRL